MEPVKCPNCDNDRFELHVYHTLNLHTGALKQAAKEDSDSIEYLTLGAKEPQTAYICSKCGYTIESLADLNILEIAVYVVGNSISKQRQGVNYISDKIAKLQTHIIDVAKILQKIGYVQYGGFWIFTKNAWKQYQQDPKFNLSESKYIIKIKDLS